MSDIDRLQLEASFLLDDFQSGDYVVLERKGVDAPLDPSFDLAAIESNGEGDTFGLEVIEKGAQVNISSCSEATNRTSTGATDEVCLGFRSSLQ